MGSEKKPIESYMSAMSIEEVRKMLREGRIERLGQSSKMLADLFYKEYSFVNEDNIGNDSRDLFTSAAVAALQCKNFAKTPSDSNKLHLTAPSVFKINSVEDLLTCTDSQFNLQVNASRDTIRIIFDAIKLLEPSFLYNDLLMLIWYLSSELNTLSKVAQMFHLPASEDPLRKLEEVASRIYRLKRNSRMYLPDAEYEEDEIVGNFKEKTNLPNVLGALCVFKWECLDGSAVSVLVVCDQNRNFRHVGINRNHHYVEDVIKNDSIYERLIEDHPRGYAYYCPCSGYTALPQLFPGLSEVEMMKCSTLFPETRHFNFAHNDVVDVVRITVREIITRFPKLNSLENANDSIIISAFILHNFCNQIQIMEMKRMRKLC